MMSGWATDLVDKLGMRAQQIGITADMPGEMFEERLGAFLAFEKSLPILRPLAHLGTEGPPQMGVSGDFERWFAMASSAVGEIRRSLWDNLFTNFGRDRIDDEKAIRAYEHLHFAIRHADGSASQSADERDNAAESFIAHATTNYDTAIEIALESDKSVEVVDGFQRRSGRGSATYTPELLTGSDVRSSTRFVPVVHLHGAVGWYSRPNGTVTAQPADEAYDDRRIPALLLPDKNKVPAGFDSPARETWLRFEQLLTMSTHVLVIGHSLHDAHVVDALRASNASICVIVHKRADPKLRPGLAGTEDEVRRIRSLLKEVTLLPGDFGSDHIEKFFDVDQLVQWLRSTGRRLHADSLPRP
jgi:hypothetical protein